MPYAESSRLTALLADVRLGHEAARDELVRLVYPELKRIAARHMRQERPGHTLRTTGLIHEVYVRLFGAKPLQAAVCSTTCWLPIRSTISGMVRR